MNTTELIWKATAILLAAFAVTTALGRSPAALRHFLWTAAFAALLALPLASLVGPSWSPVAPVSVPAAAVRVTVTAAAPAPTAPPVPWVPVVWAAGCLLAAVRFTVGAIRTSRMVRRATDLEMSDARGVRIVESAEAPLPMTWGVFRPVVILPAGTAAWPAARLRTVLLHELAHVRRRDLLAQTIAQAACCAYWFHPLAWVALRQLRKERELACDDAVLRQGVAAHDYAAHLMESARSLSAWIDAPAMAESSDLETRVTALLDRTRDRRALSALAALAVASLVAVSVVPLATMTAHAQGATGIIVGMVMDPTGARVPSCQVTVRNLDGSHEQTIAADAVGEFRFAVPSGRYSVEVAQPGFVKAKSELTVVSGANARSDMRLEVGKISEVINVRGSRQKSGASAPAPAVARTQTAERIRIGGNVQQARLIRQPKPVYSDELKQLGVEGIVRATAIISKTGAVLEVRVTNTPDPRLAMAAIDSIKQWQYTPTLLNGEPVEVLTNIDIAFQLDK